MGARHCTRTGCSATPVATLTFAYGDSTAVVGPLALRAEPGTYDLCRPHSDAVSTPRGWELIRLPLGEDAPGHSTDDLLALADAVREVGLTWEEPPPREPQSAAPNLRRRRGHLAVVADVGEVNH